MLDDLTRWIDGLSPSLSLPTVQWPLLLALAAAVGHLLQRRLALPKVAGYSAVGAVAGLAGFPDLDWPPHGLTLYLLQLGVALVLFEAGGRLPLRWFRHNPMVLLQSLAEATLTGVAVFFTLRALDVAATVAEPLAVIAMVGSPAVLSRVVLDTRASGPVTERALALTTLGTLYTLVLVCARAQVMHRPRETLGDTLWPIVGVLGLTLAVAAVLALVLRAVLRFMNPTSENTAICITSLIAAACALAAYAGGSAPLAALLAGLFLKHFHPRPWAWPRQLGTAASVLVMLNFVMVAVVAAQSPWNPAVAALVLALLAARAVAKALGVALANGGSGLRWTQAWWTAVALSPMSSVALLMVAQLSAASITLGPPIAAVALPAIVLMEVLGAILATLALDRAGESARALSHRSEAAPASPSTAVARHG